MEVLPKLPRPVLISFTRGRTGQFIRSEGESAASAGGASLPSEDAQVTGLSRFLGRDRHCLDCCNASRFTRESVVPSVERSPGAVSARPLVKRCRRKY